jgi:GPH family glycoside/pentoside/hexuronide:cation symporter
MILIAIMAAAGLRRYAIDRAGHEARLAALAAARNEASKP